MDQNYDAVDVVAAGHLCIDLLPGMATVPLAALGQPGRLSEVAALGLSTGGSVSNTGFALHRLGARVRFMALLGSDAIGDLTINMVNQRDPELTRSIKRSSGAPSSYTIVLAPERVDRIFLHCPGTNSLFGPESVDYEVAAQAKVFHLGYPPLLPRMYQNRGEELIDIFRRVKASGAVTSLDMAYPDPVGPSGQADWRGILRELLPYVDVFIPSFEEIVFMLRRADFDAYMGRHYELIAHDYVRTLTDELLSMGAAVAGVKCGEHGVMVQTGSASAIDRMRGRLNLSAEWEQGLYWHPAFKVNVVGTTGAGDSAYAGFLAALLHGKSLEDAVRWSCAVGACNCEAADSTSGIRSWDETEKRLTDQWDVVPSRLSN